MATVEFKGKTFTVDEDGFLENLDQWNRNGWITLRSPRASRN